jgi:uncharacterized protein
MKLHLNQIAAGKTEHHLSWRPRALPRLAELLAEGEPGDSGEVTADLEIQLIEGTVEVVGHVRALLTIPCARCLAPTGIELDEPFTAVQAPASSQSELGEEVQLTGYELDVDYFEGDEIDLDELVEEQALLMLPEAETCRDDCRGICAGCGRNLNETECVCAPGHSDHPFAAMKALLERR